MKHLILIQQGDYFNPENANHESDTEESPYDGDMPNITVVEDGKVNHSFLFRNVTLEKDEDNSLLDNEGTFLIIREGSDDGG